MICLDAIKAVHADDASYGPVYLLEEDPEQRLLLGAMLSDGGLAVRSFATVASLLTEISAVRPGCIVSGLDPGSCDSASLRRELGEQAWVFPIVAITAPGDVAAAVLAMKTGAVDVVSRPVESVNLVEAVRGALAARGRVHAGATGFAVNLRLARLTRRERQVLDGLVNGQANKAIALVLGISPRTVEVHRAKVMEKLGCRSLSEIVRLALQAGLGKP